MSLKTINDSPSVTDTIRLNIDTPDASGCFSADPYKVDQVQIFFIQRSPLDGSNLSFDSTTTDLTLAAQVAAARATACQAPTPDNLLALSSIEERAASASTTTPVYYAQSKLVASFGDAETFPAWLSSDPVADDAYIDHVDTDSSGNPQYGHFTLDWTPLGMSEGDYVTCWTWTPQPSGDKLNRAVMFSLSGDTTITTSLPSHATKPTKYQDLLNRFRPSQFQTKLMATDLTPAVLRSFDNCIADGFTWLENQANQMLDLVDANATPESLLNVLAAGYGLTLRSSDPTLWRRQIRNAVPLAKRKGTMGGLREALSQAGMRLRRFARLWQVISAYTWQDYFLTTTAGQTAFVLSKAYVASAGNVEAYVRPPQGLWSAIDPPPVTFSLQAGNWVATWTGTALAEGTGVRIVYPVSNVPSQAQPIEEYVRSLDLADDRDELDQQFPIKNWNVRVIEEDDPMFLSVLPVRNPYFDPVVYGRVRTTFPYSENVYNMEEYNGSLRDSTKPCDIDRYFVDQCQGGPGSKYTVDIEVDNICDDRISEARDILNDYTPFHAVLHTINLFGTTHDFVTPPMESFERLVTLTGGEQALADSVNFVFNRDMDDPAVFKRNQMAESNVVSFGDAVASNENVIFYAPTFNLESLGLEGSPTATALDVLSPSPNAGTYQLQDVSGGSAVVASNVPSDPISQAAFTCNVSNIVLSVGSASIYPDNQYLFRDAANLTLGSKVWTTAEHAANAGSIAAWAIKFGGSSYTISDVLSDGSLVLSGQPSAGTVSSYQVLDGDSVVRLTGGPGVVSERLRAAVDFGSGSATINSASTSMSSVSDISGIVSAGDYVRLGSNDYQVEGYVQGNAKQVYVTGYAGGGAGNTSASVLRRLISGKTGYFLYGNMVLTVNDNIESQLGVQNGSNPPGGPNDIVDNGTLRENFLVNIGSDYFFMAGINGGVISLVGPKHDWGVSGASVSFQIVQTIKSSVYIPARWYPVRPEHGFRGLDRNGGDLTSMVVQTQPGGTGGEFNDQLAQAETIQFVTETR